MKNLLSILVFSLISSSAFSEQVLTDLSCKKILKKEGHIIGEAEVNLIPVAGDFESMYLIHRHRKPLPSKYDFGPFSIVSKRMVSIYDSEDKWSTFKGNGLPLIEFSTADRSYGVIVKEGFNDLGYRPLTGFFYDNSNEFVIEEMECRKNVIINL